MSVLSKAYFHDEAEAFKKLEEIVWPAGPVCPHCGGKERVYVLQGVKDKKGRVRRGLKKCGHCRKQFTVRVGTVFESSHIPLHKWFQATHLLCSSKKGISAHQLHRILEITYKSAWFMAHRLREAMRVISPSMMGGPGMIVEADETFMVNKRRNKLHDVFINGRGWVKRGGGARWSVLSLIERGGNVRSLHVESLTTATANAVLLKNVARETKIMTDEAAMYREAGDVFASHEAVNHSIEEWARGIVHTNTIEGFFSIFKRGMRGVYQHCSEKHLHRYLAEYDFRYNGRKITDSERANRALEGIVGKRLTYARD